MKKAIIDQLFLGFFLLIMLVFIVATVNDERSARDKYYSLKNLTNASVLAMGNYFLLVDEDQANAEGISDGLLDKSQLGTSIKDDIVYTWDMDSNPRTVTASISNYQHPNFWYRFMNFNFFTLNATSTAKLNNGYVTNFVPIVVNGCTQTFNVGDTFDYLLKSYDLYTDTDNVGFFGAYDPSSGQSSFSHLKNLIDIVMAGGISEFDLDEQLNVATVDSTEIENDVKQIAQSFAIASFEATPMSIVVAECDSTADNLIIEKVLKITMNGVYCGDGCINEALTDCQLTDLTGGVFTSMDWDTAVSSCNSEEFFRINFTINEILKKEAVLADGN